MTYQEENNLLLKYMINEGIYSIFRKPHDQKDEQEKLFGMEMYITPDCNQNCSYCYLCKYKNELYPKELRDSETIVKNLEIFLNHCIEEGLLYPYRFDLFSGEIWDLELGQKVLETVYNAVCKGFSPSMIVIPSNFSFVLNDDSLNYIDSYMEKFDEYKIKVCWSCSNDGYYLDSKTRPFNNEEQYELKKGTEAYYRRIFDFCKKWTLGFHPMVSAHGIEHWSENFKWWIDTLEHEGFSPLTTIMFLEVRNDDWTDEAIEHYLHYLNTSVDYMLQMFTKNAKDEEEGLELFEKWVHCKLKLGAAGGNYTPLALTKDRLHPGCTVHRSLVVRLGDLAIVPCHRTSYDEFIGGYYQVENDKIVGIQAKNIQIMNQIWLSNHTGSAKCGACPYVSYCMKGCFGSQFESTRELLYPCGTVCDLYKAKFIFLYHKYSKMNILTEPEDKELLSVVEQIKETEDYKKWTSIITQII